ncbi:MAG: DNA internalization-related competence protein ComEC/Rec2 [Gaiellaceae bacterium]
MIGRLSVHTPHLLLTALCAGVASANAVRVPTAIVPVIAVCLGAFGVALPRARFALLAIGLVLAGSWWGAVRLEAIDRSPMSTEIGRAAVARVTVTGPARRTQFALRIPGRIERFGDRDVREPVLLQLPVGRSPPQGAILELPALVAEPRSGKDGFDERTWLRRHGVHVVLRGRDPEVVGRRGGLGGVADRLRSTIGAALASGVSGERRAVLLGIVLGEDEGLDEDLRDAFRASGLYHLLAVSGQNVALVAGGVLLVAWLVGIPRMAGQVGALGAIGAYVFAVGAQPSVVRAGVAGALASLAWMCARERDRWWFLLLGALVLLAWNPYNLLDPGFQLSFVAVAAIFTLVPRLMSRLEGYPLPRAAAAVVAVSIACGIATAPILLFQFGSVPAYSVIANAMAAPVVAPLLGLGVLAAAVHPIVPDVAELLVWLDGWLAAYLVLCARAVASLPHAQLSAAPVLLAAAGLTALIALARRSRTLAVAVAAAGLVAIAWRAAPDPALPPPTGLRVTFLDVGQGDATLIQVPRGSLLVDQGPPEANVAGQLRRFGIRELSLLVLTHPQRDHVGGAADVLSSTRVRVVLDPELASSVPEEHAAIAEAKEHRIPVVTARPGLEYAIGRLHVRVLWPDGPGVPSEDPNFRATVCLVSYGEVDVLLGADAESPVLLPLGLPPVEILKVSHHGSADALLPALLEEIRPRVAVISVGEGNTYGHPTPEALAALSASPGLTVYRTDRDGAVTIESDGRGLTVATED